MKQRKVLYYCVTLIFLILSFSMLNSEEIIEFDCNIECNDVPAPIGDAIKEIIGIETITVGMEYIKNDNGSSGFIADLEISGEGKRKSGSILSGTASVRAEASLDQSGNLSTNINGVVNGAFEWNFFPAKKLVKLGKISKRLSNVEMDVDVILGIEIEKGVNAGDLMIRTYGRLAFDEVRVNGYTTADYCTFDIEYGELISYKESTNKWSYSKEVGLNFDLNAGNLISYSVSPYYKATLWETGGGNSDAEISNDIQNFVSYCTETQNDFGTSGDAGSSYDTAKDIGTISYSLNRGGALNSSESDTKDWVKFTPSDNSKDILIRVIPADNDELGFADEINLNVRTDQQSNNTAIGGAGAGNEVSYVVNADTYANFIKFGIEDSDGQGNYQVFITYNQVAQAVQISSYGGTGHDVDITLNGTTKSDTGNGVIFTNVPFGNYTVTAVEDITGYNKSETFAINELLENFSIGIDSQGIPSSIYNAGSSYDDMVGDFGDAGWNWVKVTDGGETITVKLHDINETSNAAMYFFNNGDDIKVIYDGNFYILGGMKISSDNAYVGIIDGARKADLKIEYIGYNPNKSQIPIGVTDCVIGSTCFYSATATDPDGDNITYIWQFGSETITTDEVSSGTTVTIPYTWNSSGTYNVKVKIKDNNNMESDYSNSLSVIVVDPPDDYLIGDLNHNGDSADAVDLYMMSQAIDGIITPTGEYDIDGDGSVDSDDLSMLLQASAGNIILDPRDPILIAGDANEDGIRDKFDANYTSLVSTGTETQTIGSDPNYDGVVNDRDVAWFIDQSINTDNADIDERFNGDNNNYIEKQEAVDVMWDYLLGGTYIKSVATSVLWSYLLNYDLVSLSKEYNPDNETNIILETPSKELLQNYDKNYDGVIEKMELKFAVKDFEKDKLSGKDLLSLLNFCDNQDTTPEIPEIYSLSPNYPNPFNPETTISYALPEASDVSLQVFNIKGQLVNTLVNENIETGNHSVVWNGKDNNDRKVSSGIYFYRINAGEFTDIKKMLLIK
ncbi:MAG: PKD domain-containing protein [Candidatus Cloacimonetes bacterium]|nr:PKD domain-containing protein [Candidatus Cloacimonadota bacterium]